jgi:hypothetical protein
MAPQMLLVVVVVVVEAVVVVVMVLMMVVVVVAAAAAAAAAAVVVDIVLVALALGNIDAKTDAVLVRAAVTHTADYVACLGRNCGKGIDWCTQAGRD